MNQLNTLTRRHFLRHASLALAGGATALLVDYPITARTDAAHSASAPPRPQPLKFSRDLRDGLRLSRVTNAMWDFSWLTQHYPGGAFPDFSRAADALVERGFNTVRIDAFPLVIGALRSETETITIPADPLANWGMSDRDREHVVTRELTEFMRAMKSRGLSVILSSWGRDCKEYPGRIQALAKDRNGFRKAWTRTLDLLGSKDLLDPVLYIDLDQEFPYFSPFQSELNELAHKPIAAGSLASSMESAGQYPQGMARLEWKSAQMEYVRSLFSEMLPFFQSRYPRQRFTYSLTSFHTEVRSLGLQLFDVLELHLWIHSPRFDSRSGFNSITKDRGQRSYRDYADRIAAALDTVGPMLVQEMRNKCAFAQAWSEEIAAPVVTTEAWGPWWHMDHPDLDWTWLRDWCEQCMKLAAEHKFWGVTPWNYSHPYWKNWSDVRWYRKVNRRFLRS
ncbi:MAG TPA: cellulase-like family protein [Candidatus Paceibacterota bacterium]|nr:cellulase-like family protein [Verrucomicrobiota bacterium]HRY46414.1 cellulase-like family protein [Candidatus Paceibacterota bacterium]HSA02868.1 cellulase-like family protein [Candidatus Paceibacterota bacterium]